ncbi:MAG: hypothetical protein LAO21_14535 [Acidobacteriia bacterium]|nr:hypothetical protein [Terriglobia bacterium]
MPIPIRGLKTIRTFAGKTSRTFVPHKAHLQIACLEIEKTRCATERTNELRRLAELDSRLREIEAEQAALMQALSDRSKMKRGDGLPAGFRTPHHRSAVPFKIKY